MATNLERGPNLFRIVEREFESVDAFEGSAEVQAMAEVAGEYTGAFEGMEIELTPNKKWGVITLRFADVDDKDTYKSWSNVTRPDVVAMFKDLGRLPADWSGTTREYIDSI